MELAIAAASLVSSILAAAGVGYTIRVMRRMEKKADARWAEERQTALTMRVFPHKPDAIVTFHNRGEHALLDVRAGVRISGQPIIYGPAPFDLAPGAHVRLTIRIPPDSIVHAFTDSGAPNYVVDATFSDGAGRQWMAETYYDNPDDAPTLTQMPCLAGRAQTGGGRVCRDHRSRCSRRRSDRSLIVDVERQCGDDDVRAVLEHCFQYAATLVVFGMISRISTVTVTSSRGIDSR